LPVVPKLLKIRLSLSFKKDMNKTTVR